MQGLYKEGDNYKEEDDYKQINIEEEDLRYPITRKALSELDAKHVDVELNDLHKQKRKRGIEDKEIHLVSHKHVEHVIDTKQKWVDNLMSMIDKMTKMINQKQLTKLKVSSQN